MHRDSNSSDILRWDMGILSAKMYEELTFNEILNKDLAVMDSTAASLCKDNSLEIIVFNMNKYGNIVKAIKGDKIGTHVKK